VNIRYFFYIWYFVLDYLLVIEISWHILWILGIVTEFYSNGSTTAGAWWGCGPREINLCSPSTVRGRFQGVLSSLQNILETTANHRLPGSKGVSVSGRQHSQELHQDPSPVWGHGECPR
jgi:hypothetical protein